MKKILLNNIRNITAYTREHENKFIELITDKFKAEISKAQRSGRPKFEKTMQKVDKLDTISSKLHKDNVEGKIFDKCFMKISASYVGEQKSLTERIAKLKGSMNTDMKNP